MTIPLKFEPTTQGPMVRHDVEEPFAKLFAGFFRSKLAWAEALRNVAVFEKIREREPTALLDLGSGISAWLGRFVAVQQLDTECTCLDVTDTAMEAVDRLAELNPRRPFKKVKKPMTEFLTSAKPESYHFVTCLGAFEFDVKNLEAADKKLGLIARVLTSGGAFVLSCIDSAPGLPLYLPTMHSWEPDHETFLPVLQKNFSVDAWYTTRARPTYVPENKFPFLPVELAIALELPRLTLNGDGLRGDKLYFCRKERHQ